MKSNYQNAHIDDSLKPYLISRDTAPHHEKWMDKRHIPYYLVPEPKTDWHTHRAWNYKLN